MRIPHRAPFSNSLRALSVVAGSASEWLVVLIVPWEKDANPHETRFQVNMGLDSLKATLVTILNTLALTPPATHCLQNERACLELVRKMLTRWRYIWWVRQRVWRVDRWGIFITLKDFFLWTRTFVANVLLVETLPWRATWLWDFLYIMRH